MVPMVEPHLLPAGASRSWSTATRWAARWCPGAKVADLAKPGTKLAIYRFGRSLDDDARFWFHWLHDTDVARGAIPDDAQGVPISRRPASRRAGFDHGDLQRADADGLVLAKPGTKLAIYRFGRSLDDDARFWFHWRTTPTWRAARSRTMHRATFTEAGQPPRVTDSTMATSSAQMPTAWLGIPAATVRATVTVTPQPNPRRTWSASPASGLHLCRPGARGRRTR